MKKNDLGKILDQSYDLLDGHDDELATQKALALLKEAPTDPESFLLLAEVAEEKSNFAAALTWTNKGLDFNPEHLALLLKKASLLIDGFEDIDEAFAILLNIKDQLDKQSLSEQKKAYDQELLLDIYLLMADCYRLKCDFNQAFLQASIALELAPSDENAVLAKASGYFELGSYAEALKLIEPIDSRTHKADFYWLKAQINCALGLFVECDQDFNMAHKLDKDRYHRPIRLSQSNFFASFEEALMDLPDEISNFIDKTSVQIKNTITLELIKESLGTLSPQACISTDGGHKTIFLFQKNIENLAQDQEEIKDIIASALLHEIGVIITD